MKRLIALLFASMLLCEATDALADHSYDHFTVHLSGLICHITTGRQRAIIVHGTAAGMHHVGTLYVPNTVLVPILRNATGQRVLCEKGAGKFCRVMIEGFSMRIADEGDTGPIAPNVIYDPKSFCIVPKLPGLADVDPLPHVQLLLRPSMTDDLPSGPAAGFFEMTTGKVSAKPFSDGGELLDHDGDVYAGSCRQFPEVVNLTGSFATRAVLQIRSNRTLDHWVTIPIANGDVLEICVVNKPSSHENIAHVTLFEQLFWDADIPTVEKCSLRGKPCYPPNNDGDTSEVNVAAVCDQKEIHPEFTVPGCDNTQFP